MVGYIWKKGFKKPFFSLLIYLSTRLFNMSKHYSLHYLNLILLASQPYLNTLSKYFRTDGINAIVLVKDFCHGQSIQYRINICAQIFKPDLL